MIKTVLIADDNELVAQLLTKITESVGFSVIVAKDARAALEAIEKCPRFELAIIDLIMPLGSGWDVIDKFKSHPEHGNSPVVVITGARISAEERRKLLTKATAIVDKVEFNVENMKNLIVGQIGRSN